MILFFFPQWLFHRLLRFYTLIYKLRDLAAFFFSFKSVCLSVIPRLSNYLLTWNTLLAVDFFFLLFPSASIVCLRQYHRPVYVTSCARPFFADVEIFGAKRIRPLDPNCGILEFSGIPENNFLRALFFFLFAVRGRALIGAGDRYEQRYAFTYMTYIRQIYIYTRFLYIYLIYMFFFFLVYIRNIYILSLALRFRIVVSVVSFECVLGGLGGGGARWCLSGGEERWRSMTRENDENSALLYISLNIRAHHSRWCSLAYPSLRFFTLSSISRRKPRKRPRTPILSPNGQFVCGARGRAPGFQAFRKLSAPVKGGNWSYRETDSNNILLHISFSNIYITGKSLDNVTPVRRRNARDTVGQKDGISPFNTGLILSSFPLRPTIFEKRARGGPFSFEQTTVHIPAPWQLNPVGGEVNTWAIEECRLVSPTVLKLHNLS